MLIFLAGGDLEERCVLLPNRQAVRYQSECHVINAELQSNTEDEYYQPSQEEET